MYNFNNTTLEKLAAHSFIPKCRSNYFRELKGNLDENGVLILGDFAENYSFFVQDEVQGFDWNNLLCTLHPVVVYYKNGDASVSISFILHYF